MTNRMLPVLLAVLLTAPAAHAQGIKDFLNFSRAIGKEVSVTDRNGFIREGIVEAVTADQVTLRIGATTESFPRTVVASADRVKDERVDGAVKGALLGLLGLAVSYQGCGTTDCSFWKTAIVAGALGYLIDAAESHPQPLYRGPQASTSPLKITFRF